MSKKKNNKTGQKYKYVPLYTESDFNKDKEYFEHFEKLMKNENNQFDYKHFDYEKFRNSFRRLVLNDVCSGTKIIEDGTIGRIKIEDARMALENPSSHWKTLLQVSEELMRISPYYFRLNNMYSNMALFCWGIDLYGVKDNVNTNDLKNRYTSLASKLESMSLKHEFSKIMKYLPYQDVFCGLIVESQNDFFIQKINFSNCELYQIKDGLFNFRINLSSIKREKLSAYPTYVQDAYIDYIEGKVKSYWYIPPADKQICLKFNSQWTYPFPLLIGLVRDIIDLDIYKKLKLQSARTDNYKAIMIKVPIDENFVDKPLLTPDVLAVFAELNRESMTDDIGIIHVVGDGAESVSFKDSNNTRNNVSDAVDEIYNSSGESKELFNGSSSGTALTFSIENSSGFVYGVYRQFERWVNCFIKTRKYNKSTFKFSFYLLDITIFNRDNVSKRYREACTLGATVIDKWMASLDMTPSRILGSYILHEDIFDFRNKFIPLSSSFNNTNSESGRPTNEEKGELLSEEGEKTAEGEKNKK